MSEQRAHWGSKAGFVLAAAGSAVGLGNIWKFPYITGENGGGWFVLIYLVCVALVGLPIMMAEILIGRTAQTSPVGAFRSLSRPGSLWMGTGWLGVGAAFIILSYYSVVAGWSMHYAWLSAGQGFTGMDAASVQETFGAVYQSPSINLFWHVVFMVLTIAIVLGGIQKGVERWSRILMPLLFVMLLALMFRAMATEGFGPAVDFIFGPHAEKLRPAGVLEALGHSFFTLSLGLGAMITYGSYLRKDDDIVSMSMTISVLDTLIALMACLVLFPIMFSYGLEPAAGPGLVFVSLPIAFAQLPGGAVWAFLFFVLLTFAALTSSISLLEVSVSYFIDEKKWSRRAATLACGIAIILVGIPSALSGGTAMFGNDFKTLTSSLFGAEHGRNWFDFFDYLASNWMLPLGGLFIALFTAWRMGGEVRRAGFLSGTGFGRLYWGWIFLLRYIVPIGVTAVFLHAVGLI